MEDNDKSTLVPPGEVERISDAAYNLAVQHCMEAAEKELFSYDPPMCALINYKLSQLKKQQ